jgi:Domain of unknown function (DUF5979)
MIRLRSAAAVALTSVLATFGVTTSATAQTTNSTLTVNVRVKGPAPTGVTGYIVTTTCRLLQNNVATTTVSSTYSATGGSLPQVFSLAPASNCSVKVAATGTGAASGLVVVSIGGVPRNTGYFGPTQTVDSPEANAAPVAASNTIDVAITYPSLTVRKAVVGDELTPGFEYTMSVGCIYGTGASAGGTTFKLKSGGSKLVTIADIPGLLADATCHVVETTTGGASSTSYSSTNDDGTLKPGITLSSDPTAANPLTAAGICPEKFANLVCKTPYTFVSGGAFADGQTITVTNRFVGDLVVSKVVVGDPKSNIGIYEIKVACTNPTNTAPNETFLLKDRQSKVFTDIISNTVCTVTETRSDGATASYSDNSVENATDGKVVIKGTAAGCIDSRLSTFPDCRANVIVTNTYGTTAPATTAAAPATTTPAVVTTAAPIAPAPIEEPAVLDESEETVG